MNPESNEISRRWKEKTEEDEKQKKKNCIREPDIKNEWTTETETEKDESR